MKMALTLILRTFNQSFVSCHHLDLSNLSNHCQAVVSFQVEYSHCHRDDHFKQDHYSFFECREVLFLSKFTQCSSTSELMDSFLASIQGSTLLLLLYLLEIVHSKFDLSLSQIFRHTS
jgi:hypothetical protein